VKGLTPDAVAAACAYPWPGNIRELRNVLEASLALESGDLIGLPVLAQFIDLPRTSGEEETGTFAESGYEAAVNRFEADYLRTLLRSTNGNVEAAAADAGINVATIYRKMKKHGIRREELS
jgi:DNA-binding NtrC family response regulator